MRTLLLTIGILGLSSPVFGDDGVVFCYWGAWANVRPGLGKFGVSDLPRDLCTHLVYSFIGLNEEGTLTFPENETVIDGKSNIIDDFLALRDENSNLKMLVAIGGWLEGSENFSTVSNNDTLRATFVANLVRYVGERGFDGLDVDWEYPGQRGGAETDKEAFVWLLRDLKAEFEPRGWLLTSAVDVTQDHIDLSYDVPGMSQYLDYINLMTYDLQGPYDSVTRAHAALYPQLTDDPDVIYNTHAGVNVWINNGAPASKLVLGLPNYGRAFNLTSLDQTGTAAPANGPGVAGVFTGEAGFWSYYEICLHQLGNVWSITEVEGNYVYGNFGHFWIGYDNQNTIYAKAAYAKRSGLAGIMYWAMDLDDFAGYCGPAYPLISEGVRGWAHSGVTTQTVSFIAILAAVVAFIGRL